MGGGEANPESTRAFAPYVAAATPNVAHVQTSSPEATATQTPDVDATPVTMFANQEDALLLCPAPKQALVQRYTTEGAYYNDGGLPKFDTGAAIQEIGKDKTNAAIVEHANAALAGKVTIRFATKKDNRAPLDNLYNKDRPAPTRPTDIPVDSVRTTVQGVLEAFDGQPQALGTLRGKPLSVVLTKGIKTPERVKHKVSGDYSGEDNTMVLDATIFTDRPRATASAKHEIGHVIGMAPEDYANQVIYSQDPYARRPTNLTIYSQESLNSYEAAADVLAINNGATFGDELPGAETDAANRQIFGVQLARLAEQGPIQEQTANALYNRSNYAGPLHDHRRAS
jgi:hypothetical protein